MNFATHLANEFRTRYYWPVAMLRWWVLGMMVSHFVSGLKWDLGGLHISQGVFFFACGFRLWSGIRALRVGGKSDLASQASRSGSTWPEFEAPSLFNALLGV
ncbi:MAG: hypothetical protein K1X79_12385, partial [Oligoflexia bacterium]|nr:hypothetical protein [Oligoflexia bacterium]